MIKSKKLNDQLLAILLTIIGVISLVLYNIAF